jgi:hypothetical protein
MNRGFRLQVKLIIIGFVAFIATLTYIYLS